MGAEVDMKRIGWFLFLKLRELAMAALGLCLLVGLWRGLGELGWWVAKMTYEPSLYRFILSDTSTKRAWVDMPTYGFATLILGALGIAAVVGAGWALAVLVKSNWEEAGRRAKRA